MGSTFQVSNAPLQLQHLTVGKVSHSVDIYVRTGKMLPGVRSRETRQQLMLIGNEGDFNWPVCLCAFHVLVLPALYAHPVGNGW